MRNSIEDDLYYQKLKGRRRWGSNFNSETFFSVGGMLLLFGLFVAGAVGRGFLIDTHDAIRAVETSGYTEPRVIEETRFFPGLFGCSESDAAGFTVRAKNPQGNPVTVMVCIGWPFKGATVRIP